MMGNILTASAKLLVKLHSQGSRSIDLTADSFTIGRKPDNDLPIDDHTVSSRHAPRSCGCNRCISSKT